MNERTPTSTPSRRAAELDVTAETVRGIFAAAWGRGWQRRLAETLGVSTGAVSTWMNADKFPALAVHAIRRLAEQLACPPGALQIVEDLDESYLLLESGGVPRVVARGIRDKSLAKQLATAPLVSAAARALLAALSRSRNAGVPPEVEALAADLRAALDLAGYEGEAAFGIDKRGRLCDAIVQILNEIAGRFRRDTPPEFFRSMAFDPDMAGVDARILVLQVAPSAAELSEGVASIDSLVAPLRRVAGYLKAAGIDRRDAALWYLCPWHRGAVNGAQPRRIGTIPVEDRADSLRQLEQVVAAMPKLKAVILMGEATWGAEESLARTGLVAFKVGGVQAGRPDAPEIHRGFAAAAALLDEGDD